MFCIVLLDINVSKEQIDSFFKLKDYFYLKLILVYQAHDITSQ
jgi:hypothetical protein